MEHTKQKGNLGYSSTLKELHKLGLNVFTEIGDYSKIDLIVEYESKLIKLQIKYADDKKGIATLCCVKSGPNKYKYKYTECDVDIFSVYLPTADKVIFIPAKEALKTNTLTLRLEKSKNNQNKSVHYIDEYSDLAGILRDFTLGISKKDDDKVQTTTVTASEN